jgi:transposase-like protein
MRTEKFQALSAQVDQLTPRQRQLLAHSLNKIQGVEVVKQLIESKVVEAPACPQCGHEKVARWGSASGLQRYRCTSCKSTFNALTGTPLARLRHKDKWVDYAQQMIQGASVRKSAKATDIHRNTAFRWRHRFLASPAQVKATRLVGIAEADETYFLESFKGKKQGMQRSARRRGGKASKCGLSREQIAVLICRDRSGSTADFVLKKADSAHICEVLQPLIAKDTILCTDSGRALKAAAKTMGATHRAVNLQEGIRVVANVYHVQNVNAYGSRLKTWMRRFNGVATCHLESYMGWRRMLDLSQGQLTAKALLSVSLNRRQRFNS